MTKFIYYILSEKNKPNISKQIFHLSEHVTLDMRVCIKNKITTNVMIGDIHYDFLQSEILVYIQRKLVSERHRVIL